jgi:hypothetical protein
MGAFDITLHAWDLATAIGPNAGLDSALIDHVLGHSVRQELVDRSGFPIDRNHTGRFLLPLPGRARLQSSPNARVVDQEHPARPTAPTSAGVGPSPAPPDGDARSLGELGLTSRPACQQL